MSKTSRILIVILLAFLGITAIYGGLMLIMDPSGQRMQMPLSFLEQSPFSDYLIPGIILFLFNGVLSLVVMMFLLLKSQHAPWLIILQGAVLITWLVVQIIMVGAFYAPLHLPYLLVGALLVVFGILLRKRK
jgi:hypothetical protein